MILINNSINLRNPSSLLSYFSGKGRNIDLLSNCNLQEFKWIDGCGEGYFLVDYGVISSVAIKLNLIKGATNYERSLLITDSIVLESDDDPKLQLIKTSELKYILNNTTASRNYNIIDPRTIVGATGATLAPDTTAKSIVQIIKNIDSTVEVVWNTTTIRPFNVFIDGMSLTDVIDMFCKAYGLLWTVEYSIIDSVSTVTIYVYPGTALNTTTSIIPSDVNKPKPIQSYKDIETIYPVLDNGLQVPINYYSKKSTSSGAKCITAYNPFFPTLIEPGTSTVVNDTALTTVHNFVQPNLYNIIKLENYYYVHSHIEPYSHLIAPKALKYTFGHTPAGLRTFLFSGKYPVLDIPEHNKSDRQARNVVGYLQYSYFSSPYFWVYPVYGLDGYINPSIHLLVENIYNWDYGAENAKVRIEWDPINRRWIPLQQEYVCPPDEEPPAVPAPETPPTYPTIEL